MIYVVLVVAASGAAAGAQLYASAPQERGQFHRAGPDGFNYGYNTGDGIAKVEVRRPDGSIVGSYRYFDPLGRQVVRSYFRLTPRVYRPLCSHRRPRHSQFYVFY